MKKFSFLALIASVMCLLSCGPKETQTSLEGTKDYVLYSQSDVPNKYGIKRANGLALTPNVYSSISYVQGLFIVQLDNKYCLLTPENTISFQSSSPISYNADLQCFETTKGEKSTFFFPQEKSKITGAFESYLVDVNGNIYVEENQKFGVYNKSGRLIIPINNENIIVEEGRYITLNPKDSKLPMRDDKGKITNWKRVVIAAFDKDGKEAEAPTVAQVKELLK